MSPKRKINSVVAKVEGSEGSDPSLTSPKRSRTEDSAYDDLPVMLVLNHTEYPGLSVFTIPAPELTREVHATFDAARGGGVDGSDMVDEKTKAAYAIFRWCADPKNATGEDGECKFWRYKLNPDEPFGASIKTPVGPSRDAVFVAEN